ncbi:hypothetical protein BZA05DRAFT_406990 [Tricharina praecox]|uniref:uncharacterized protein n=1 Tax=Tricharina praecox TaxID=43433 RepID=UPI00221ED629|nr:uncharacterized protein BZA05DRAFT_406990 [Tricharina praecox]KAI5846110.1 hypothetical protein BZA05DRAFT_406990 [Tricharina praecox]
MGRWAGGWMGVVSGLKCNVLVLVLVGCMWSVWISVFLGAEVVMIGCTFASPQYAYY